MNPGLVVKLRPAGPWRIGPDSGARNRVDAIYHSDSLYSAVTSAMARMGMLEPWLDSTARSATPAVCFSSCFPFLDEIGFVVPPRTHWPPAPRGLATSRVRWKSARFVPVTVVQSILGGERLNENHWSVDGASGCLVPVGRPGPFRTGVRWNAAVDRLTGASERHSTACIEFRPGSGLWTIAGFLDEAARDQWQGPVKAAFRLLADTGFGGERSRGWGRSETPEFSEGILPEMVIEYRRKERRTVPEPQVSASDAVPDAIENGSVAADLGTLPPQESQNQMGESVADASLGQTEIAPTREIRQAEAPAPPLLPDAPPEPESSPQADEHSAASATEPDVSVSEPALTDSDVTSDAVDPSIASGTEPSLSTSEPPEANIEAKFESDPSIASATEPNTSISKPTVSISEPTTGAATVRERSSIEPLLAEAESEHPSPEEAPVEIQESPQIDVAPSPSAPSLQAHWMLSLFTPAAADTVDWARGNYTVLARGGRIDSPSGSGELKKQIQMVAEGSVLYADGAPLGAAPDVAPDGFAHPVFRAGFALTIPLPEVH